MSSRAALRRRLEVAEAAERAAVEGDHHVGLGREVVRLREQVEARAARGSAARRRTASENDATTSRPAARSTWKQAEHRAERVAVGVHVARRARRAGRRRSPRAAAAPVEASTSVISVSRLSRSSLAVEVADDLLDALPLLDRRVFAEGELGRVLQAHLAAERGAQVRCGRPQGSLRRHRVAPARVPARPPVPRLSARPSAE